MKFVLYLVFYYLNFSAYILHVLIFFHGITLSFNTFFTCEHFKDDYKHMKYTVCGAKNHSNSKHDLCRNGFETICSKISQSDHVLRVNDQTYMQYAYNYKTTCSKLIIFDVYAARLTTYKS